MSRYPGALGQDVWRHRSVSLCFNGDIDARLLTLIMEFWLHVAFRSGNVAGFAGLEAREEDRVVRPFGTG